MKKFTFLLMCSLFTFSSLSAQFEILQPLPWDCLSLQADFGDDCIEEGYDGTIDTNCDCIPNECYYGASVDKMPDDPAFSVLFGDVAEADYDYNVYGSCENICFTMSVSHATHGFTIESAGLGIPFQEFGIDQLFDEQICVGYDTGNPASVPTNASISVTLLPIIETAPNPWTGGGPGSLLQQLLNSITGPISDGGSAHFRVDGSDLPGLCTVMIGD